MGTDVYSAVFRIKGRKLPVPATFDDLMLPLIDLKLRPDQLEFLTTTNPEAGGEVAYAWQETPGRRYELLSWLGCEGRGWLRSIFEYEAYHQDNVEVFLDDLDEQLPPNRTIQKDYLRVDRYGSFVVSLALLRSFDYDQKIPAIRKVEYEGRVRYQERFAEFKDRTFRDLFTPEWFAFLAWTEQNDWDYLLYQFVE